MDVGFEQFPDAHGYLHHGKGRMATRKQPTIRPQHLSQTKIQLKELKELREKAKEAEKYLATKARQDEMVEKSLRWGNNGRKGKGRV